MKANPTTTPAIARETPARAPSVASDAHVPITVALISGGLSAFCVVCVAGIALELLGFRGDMLPVLGVIGVLAFAGLTTWFWFRELRQTQRTLWQRETVQGVDLDGDGKIGAPPVRWVPTRGQNIVPVSPTAAMDRFEQFIRWAYDQVNDNQPVNTIEARAAGYGDVYKQYMEALEQSGLARRTRKGDNSKRELVEASADICIKRLRSRGMLV